MGLHAGSVVFIDFLPILKQASFVPNDDGATTPVLLSWDVMSYITASKGCYSVVPFAVPGITPPFRANFSENKNGTLGNHLCGLLVKIHTFVRCHTNRQNIRVVLVCDSSTLVPAEKKREQAKRSINRSGFQEGCVMTPKGLVLDQGVETKLDNMYQFMGTREMRKNLYSYLYTLILAFPWSINFDLVLEAGFSHGPCSFEFQLGPQPARVQAVEHSGQGEGELGALKWAIKFAESHEVQLHSGDLDMLLLALIHGHKFKHDLHAVICNRYLFSYRDAVKCLEEKTLCVDTVVLASLMLGTDFVEKKQTTHRGGSVVVFNGVDDWKKSLDNSASFLEHFENTSAAQWTTVLTNANQKLKKSTSASCKIHTTELGLEQVRFNWNYWVW